MDRAVNQLEMIPCLRRGDDGKLWCVRPPPLCGFRFLLFLFFLFF